jgi:hypothetical protein
MEALQRSKNRQMTAIIKQTKAAAIWIISSLSIKKVPNARNPKRYLVADMPRMKVSSAMIGTFS